MSLKNSPNEPFYISLEVVLEIHQRQLKEFGGEVFKYLLKPIMPLKSKA